MVFILFAFCLKKGAKMNFIKKIVVPLGLAFVTFSLFNFSSVATADETAFYVQPIIPDNQVAGTTDYFNLETTTIINQTLQLMITNEASEPKKLTIKLLDGMTTSEGSISYDTQHVYDETVKYKFSDFAKAPESIEIAGSSSEVVDIPLKLDISAFKGILLGAINVSEEKKTDTSNGGVANVFAYNTPVKIRLSPEVTPSSLNYKGMDLALVNSEKLIEMTFQNPAAEIIRGLSLRYQIFPKGETKEVLSVEKTALEIAPNSRFSPKLSLKGQNLKAGNYILKIKASSDKIEEEWESEFTITGKDAQSLNEGFEVSNRESTLWLWVILGFIGLGFLLGIAYYFYRKKTMTKKA